MEIQKMLKYIKTKKENERGRDPQSARAKVCI